MAALPVFLTASLAPEMGREFAFGAAALGISIGSYFAVSSVASSPAGRLVARTDTTSGIRLTIALTVICSLGVAGFVESTPALVMVLVIGGLANAVSGPAASALLTRELDASRQGAGYGALTAGAPAASLLAGLALPLVAEPLGWRVAFVLVAGLALVIGLVAGLQGREGHRMFTALPSARATRSVGPARRSAVHMFAVSAALASAGITGMMAFLVVYSVESGLTAAEAGVLLAVASLAAGASRVAFGVAADRIRESADTYLVVLFVVSSAGFLLLIGGTPTTIIPGALIAGGLGWGAAGLLNLAAVRVGTHTPSEAVGIAFTGIFVGALIGPVVTGLIAASVGYGPAWALGALLQLAAAATAKLAVSASLDSGERGLI
ncbi:MAG: MFS transporter [Solirubrobacterales bacterium]